MNEAELLEAPQLSSDETRRLALLERSGLLERDGGEVFHQVARLARRLLGVDAAIVSVIDRDRHRFVGHDGLRPDLAARGESIAAHSYCKHVVATGEPVMIEDARVTPLLRNRPATAGHDALAYAGIPLAVADGVVLGTLCALDSSPRGWSAQDLATLEELAAVAVTALEHRVDASEIDGVTALAGRLEDPVAKLGDVVRTVAGLIEQTGSDSQLPRLADVARSRVTTIEALTQDLVHATRTGQPRLALLATVDVRRALQHAGRLASGAVHAGDLVLDLPDDSVTIDWPAAPLNRALTLLVATAMNHRGPGDRVTVRLTSSEHEAHVTVDVAARVPVGELLRVVGHFRDRHDEELPLRASSGSAGTTAGNNLITATATSTGTTFVVRLPR